jgi:NAD(P)-dependent dehydrogenase (short-subunit alcohol dehydrogenase family)
MCEPRLAGHTALVTGAASGIGAATARRLAAEGATVVVADRDREGATVVAKEIDGIAVELDVTIDDSIRAAIAEAEAATAPVDVLVNNAGGGFYANFLDVNDKGQDALVRENFVSVTNFIRGAVPLFPETGGSIVNLTSIEAHRAAPGYGVYSAMKAAVASLTRTLALELGDRTIRVNCIAPDVIPTPGIGGEVEVQTPLPRAGHVDDVAAAAVFLASDLSSFVTGSTIHVDGGNVAAGGWHRLEDGTFAT